MIFSSDLTSVKRRVGSGNLCGSSGGEKGDSAAVENERMGEVYASER